VDLPLPPAAEGPEHAVDTGRGALVPIAARPPHTPARAAPDARDAASDVDVTEPAVTRELRLDVRRGESLYILFRRHDLNQADLIEMLRSDRALGARLRRLQPGQRLQVTATSQGRVERLILEVQGPQDLLVERDDDEDFTWRRIPDADADPAASTAANTPAPDVPVPPAAATASTSRCQNLLANPHRAVVRLQMNTPIAISQGRFMESASRPIKIPTTE